ncbi:MAG: beta-lactamase family protein, partial [Firmicutes bacterium]|nr:beta-lactamase family protein [Bacillota bacterium]
MVMHMMGGKGADLWHLFKIWKVGILVLLATMLFLRSHAAGAAEQHSSLQDFTAHLDKRIPALMKYYDIPGASIALVQNGRAAWSKAYGYADLENERRMTTDTYCRVESLSKPVTAWG